MFRRFATLIMTFVLLAGTVGLLWPTKTLAQQGKGLTAEQIVGLVFYVYSNGRPDLFVQVRRNGYEKGKTTRIGSDGRTEEATYERRFVRGESSDKDKIRLDQKFPTMEYSLVYGGGRTWGIINGAPFTPKQEAAQEFLSQQWHGLDALLRYKENGSTLNLVGKDKQKNIDLHIVDVIDKEKRRTRYYISAKTYKVLWLEYEETPVEGGTPVKYKKQFQDYRVAQGTLVPYRIALYVDGKQTQETRVLNVTYGLKMEDSLFQNPETQASATP